jgi:hypothetical protein
LSTARGKTLSLWMKFLKQRISAGTVAAYSASWVGLECEGLLQVHPSARRSLMVIGRESLCREKRPLCAISVGRVCGTPQWESELGRDVCPSRRLGFFTVSHLPFASGARLCSARCSLQ